MRKIALVIVGVIAVYMSSVYVRAYLSEREAERYAVDALFAMAKPWNGEELEKRASRRLKISPYADSTKPYATPDKITWYGSYKFGNLVQVDEGPDCEMNMSIAKFPEELVRRSSEIAELHNKRSTYAECSVTVDFEKIKSVRMNVVLIDEVKSWYIGYDSWRIELDTFEFFFDNNRQGERS